MLTDTQLTAVIGALTLFFVGFAGLVKWAISQWLADRKEERVDRKEDRTQDRAATTAVATAVTTMTLKFDSFEKQLKDVQWGVEEISGVHNAPPEPPPRAPAPARKTPAAGFPIQRLRRVEDPDR